MTRALAASDPDAAFAAAAEEVTDWDGGTRIGAQHQAALRRVGAHPGGPRRRSA